MRPRLLSVLGVAALLPGIAPAQQIVGWGDSSSGQLTPPVLSDNEVTHVSAGYGHALALLYSRKVVAWGRNADGECNVPAAAQSGVLAISARGHSNLALTTAGKVVAWGLYRTVPLAAQTDVSAIACGGDYNLALKNGKVLAWGFNGSGQTRVPVAATTNVTAIATGGGGHVLALKAGGGVIAWGKNNFDQCKVPNAAKSNVVAIAAGYNHSVALKANGSVVAWGDNSSGQCNVPSAASSGVVRIAVGGSSCLALKADGSVVAWGDNSSGQGVPPVMAGSGVVDVSCGEVSSFALRAQAWATLDQKTVYAGYAATGTVHLADANTKAAVKVRLVRDNPVAQIPDSVTVPKGATEVDFPVATEFATDTDRSAVIRTNFGGATVPVSLSVKKRTVTAAFDKSEFIVGSKQWIALTVTLDAPATQDTTFDLATDSELRLPKFVTIPAGQQSAVGRSVPAASVPFGAQEARVSYNAAVAAASSINARPMQAFVSVVGPLQAGGKRQAKVQLEAVPSVAFRVSLDSQDSELSYPGTVLVKAGKQEATFDISIPVNVFTHTSNLIARLHGIENTAQFKVVGMELSTLKLSLDSVKGGGKVSATVTLKAPAPVDVVVDLASSDPVAKVPTTVTIPAGLTSATFQIQTSSVTKAKTAAISTTIGTGTSGEQTLKRNLKVTP